MRVSKEKPNAPVYDAFASQVSLYRDKTAIVDSSTNTESTYAELLSKIDQCARMLISKGLCKGDVVAIVLSPSSDFIVAMLACFKLGLPYIPLNVNYPKNYIQHIIADAGIATLISKPGMAVEGYPIISIEDIAAQDYAHSELPSIQVCPEDAAYVIYTSGSTGTPKGVVITQQNLLSLMEATTQLYSVTQHDIGVLFHSISFDFSVWEICLSLFNGGKLIIPPESVKQSIQDYARFLITQKVSIVNITPAMLYLLQEELVREYSRTPDLTCSLRYVMIGGDVLYPSKLKRWFACSQLKEVALCNMYGITEGTIHATLKKITATDCAHSTSPIGLPLPNMITAVVNEDCEMVEDDAVGELCLAGPSVTTGYLHRPESNQESFFSKQFPGEELHRYFKTQDLVKRLKNGSLEYIGRKNNLVKIRGFRVSLKEIERHLMRNDAIENAVVLTFLGSDTVQRLVAYLQGKQKNIDIAAVRQRLRSELPAFMCPAQFVVLETFPLTLNGKVDFKLLKAQGSMQSDQQPLPVGETTTEERIKAVWQKVLKREDVGLEENFFDAGGDSLLLPSLLFGLQEISTKKIDFIDIVKFPSIKQFAVFIDTAKATNLSAL